GITKMKAVLMTHKKGLLLAERRAEDTIPEGMYIVVYSLDYYFAILRKEVLVNHKIGQGNHVKKSNIPQDNSLMYSITHPL
ncbi:MAG: hypothetical protein KAH23_09290, partial [Kiritimatiellae bacterium]|nr:hypothetical protein [Kiritimatiellia bacterium]